MRTIPHGSRLIVATAGSVLAVIAGMAPTAANADSTTSVATADAVVGAVAAAADQVGEPGSETNSLLSIPLTGAGQVELGSNGDSIAFGLPPVTGSADIVDGVSVFEGADEGTHITVEPLATGSRTSVVISASDAPTTYPFTFDDDVSLAPNSDGSIDVRGADGQVVGEIAAAWAVDSVGNSVPTHYEVDGNVVVQVVDHTSADLVYPVVADPTLHWWGIEWLLSKSQTDKLILYMNTGVGAAGVTALLCAGTIAGAVPCGIGYGLVAAIGGIGSGFVSYCNRGSNGIKLRYNWVIFTCAAR